MLILSTIVWLALTATEIPTHEEVERAYADLCAAAPSAVDDSPPSRLRHLMPSVVVTLDRRPRATANNQHDHYVYPDPMVDTGADQLDEWGRLQLRVALRWQRQPSPAPSLPSSATTDPVCARWPGPHGTADASLQEQIDAWSTSAMWRTHHHLSSRPEVRR